MVSNEWLSNKIRRNIRTVKRLKSKLEGLNLIKVDRSGVGRGGVATIRINEYQVNEMFGYYVLEELRRVFADENIKDLVNGCKYAPFRDV